MDIGEMIGCVDARIEDRSYHDAIIAALRRLKNIDETVGRAFDPDMSNPPENVWAKSLRLVPKLLELKARAKEILVVIDAQREGRGMDVVYDAGTTTAAFRAALAALDAGEGK